MVLDMMVLYAHGDSVIITGFVTSVQVNLIRSASLLTEREG